MTKKSVRNSQVLLVFEPVLSDNISLVHSYEKELLTFGASLSARVNLPLNGLLLTSERVGEEARDAFYSACQASGMQELMEMRICENAGVGSWVEALSCAVRETSPELILFASSAFSSYAAAVLAGELGAKVHTETTRWQIHDQRHLYLERHVLAGSVCVKELAGTLGERVDAKAPILAVLSRSLLLEEPSLLEEKAEDRLQIVRSKWEKEGKTIQLISREPLLRQDVRLEEASIVVAGGRGLGGPEGFKLLKELAELLGGEVAASKQAVNLGWISAEHQVGQTGAKIRADLYIACGISGSIQHKAGIRGAKCIVAINTDPKAAIFQVADYGVVADIYDVVPAMIKKLKKQSRR